MEKQINVHIDEEHLRNLRSLTLQKHGVLHGALKEELTSAIKNHILKLEDELEGDENFGR